MTFEVFENHEGLATLLLSTLQESSLLGDLRSQGLTVGFTIRKLPPDQVRRCKIPVDLSIAIEN